MVYFRLIEQISGRTPLGYGMAGGRWNRFGTPMIYGCSCSALNFLELLSIKGPVVATSSWLLVMLEIIGEVPSLSVDDLPNNWNVRPYPNTTQEFGTQWVKEKLSSVLKIPSCRIPISRYPEEHNLLINPLHGDFQNMVKIKSIENVSFEVNH